ncbi:hypothetical protein Cgig2_004628 [Carnegiea gigantea]|uniref:Uncharacterized protein n=1 Tax=Carnegiea gigantea TaxID=171969 RepID=A0A9Q1JTN8_9CARY|nr:hypothetical protein Cgig2_004628 [Carnegiea gigantea]
MVWIVRSKTRSENLTIPFLRAQNSLKFDNEERKIGKENRITVEGRLQAYQKRNSAAMDIFLNTIAVRRGQRGCWKLVRNFATNEVGGDVGWAAGDSVFIYIQDLTKKPKYLVAFTVGYAQKDNINACVKKFSDDFQILLFHYDDRTSEWDQFEWSKRAVHVSAPRQTKWWYAKRFLHPDVVAAYEYIFIWDEDLDVQHFSAEKYIQLVKKHGLEISQPGLEPNNGLTWQMTKRRGDREVHKYALRSNKMICLITRETEEKPGWCSDPHLPPCAAFVEIMAPVFSRTAWRCVWHMIQNDLVHGWGLDFALRRCVDPAHEKIGVVDSQWIIHKVIPSLGSQGKAENGKAPWQGVRERCKNEWAQFQNRLAIADKAYLAQIGKS